MSRLNGPPIRQWWSGPEGARQSLRTQVLLLLAVLILPSLALVLVVIPGIIERRFAQIERDQVTQFTQIAQQDLLTEERRVALFVLNFSQWSETYEFAAGRNMIFPQSALVPSTFTGGRIDYVGIASPARQLITGLTLKGDTVVAATDLVGTLMTSLPRTLPPGGASGVVQVRGKPYLLAGRTITRDDGSGDGGVLMFARSLDPQALDQLMHREQAFTARVMPMPAGGVRAVQFAPVTVNATTPLTAPSGPPQLALQLSIPRDMYRAAQATVFQLKVVAALFTLLTAMAFMLFLNRRVLRVLGNYVQDTQRIPRDPGHRLDGQNRTELGVLARTINDLLDHLQGREAQLREQARRDELTGTYSRAGLTELLREDPTIRSALLIEVPRLQELSGLYGSAFVDRLISELAGRLQELGPDHVVGRLSSNGLALITRLPATTDPLAVLKGLERPFALREGEVTLKLVAGFSQSAYPVPFSALQRQAFLALQHAMDRKEHLGIFNEEMLRRSQYGHTLETQLQGAVTRNELSLMYQPISDVLTGQWVSLEALMRWQHPQLGTVPPSTFIPVAERSGQIYQLGDWALQTAARDIQEARALWPGAHVNVNVSPVQLLMPDFAERALKILSDLGVSPTLLTFEVTESTVMQNVDLACRHLARLRSAGVRIALDDFGSGHSSLSLLTELPLDVVKLDRSFLREGIQDTARGALLRNTIRLARDLNLATVAEGVEDAGMLQRLQELGCEYAQGYHVSRPDYLEDLLALRT
ncbi:putative bifunctional diguanylate cyclase/phosphodiesterase [Deinococcus aquaticus]|uniref:putative bifunctional diguanylate cyclase/phosphodiesterase n=1 Tax=Deinococcus aquaticus TaxID=328692 RepID=UPI003F48DA72